MIQIEPIMSQLDEFLIINTHKLIVSIIEEDFETSCKIRDDINIKIDKIYKVLLKNDLTKLDPVILLDILNERQQEYIKEFEEIFEIPEERRLLFNI